MSNVLIEKNTIDLLANAISDKSGVPVTMTLGEMIEAVDSIEAGSAEPVLQTKTATYTPSTTAVTDTVTADSGYDGLEEVDVTVNAVPTASLADEDYVSEFYNDGNVRKWRTRHWADYGSGGFIDGVHYSSYMQRNAVPSNTTITPTESSQTIGGYNYMMEGAVTVNAIPSNYVGSGITQRSSSDLTASGATVTVPSGYYSAQSSKAVSSGSATPASTISATGATVTTGTNTLTLSKSVSNTPTVSAGYISSGTAGNSSVSLTASVTTQAAQTIYPSTSDQTISASRYLTGAQTIKAVTTSNLSAENIKSGVTITVGDSVNASRVASVTGTYTGGGGTLSVGSTTWTNSSTSTVTHEFTGLSGTPKFAVLRCTASMARSSSSTNYHIADIVWNGTSCVGNSFRRSNGTYANVTSGYTASVSGSSITFTSNGTATTNPGSYYNGAYELIYVY